MPSAARCARAAPAAASAAARAARCARHEASAASASDPHAVIAAAPAGPSASATAPRAARATCALAAARSSSRRTARSYSAATRPASASASARRAAACRRRPKSASAWAASSAHRAHVAAATRASQASTSPTLGSRSATAPWKRAHAAATAPSRPAVAAGASGATSAPSFVGRLPRVGAQRGGRRADALERHRPFRRPARPLGVRRAQVDVVGRARGDQRLAPRRPAALERVRPGAKRREAVLQVEELGLVARHVGAERIERLEPPRELEARVVVVHRPTQRGGRARKVTPRPVRRERAARAPQRGAPRERQRPQGRGHRASAPGRDRRHGQTEGGRDRPRPHADGDRPDDRPEPAPRDAAVGSLVRRREGPQRRRRLRGERAHRGEARRMARDACARRRAHRLGLREPLRPGVATRGVATDLGLERRVEPLEGRQRRTGRRRRRRAARTPRGPRRAPQSNGRTPRGRRRRPPRCLGRRRRPPPRARAAAHALQSRAGVGSERSSASAVATASWAAATAPSRASRAWSSRSPWAEATRVACAHASRRCSAPGAAAARAPPTPSPRASASARAACAAATRSRAAAAAPADSVRRSSARTYASRRSTQARCAATDAAQRSRPASASRRAPSAARTSSWARSKASASGSAGLELGLERRRPRLDDLEGTVDGAVPGEAGAARSQAPSAPAQLLLEPLAGADPPAAARARQQELHVRAERVPGAAEVPLGDDEGGQHHLRLGQPQRRAQPWQVGGGLATGVGVVVRVHDHSVAARLVRDHAHAMAVEGAVDGEARLAGAERHRAAVRAAPPGTEPRPREGRRVLQVRQPPEHRDQAEDRGGLARLVRGDPHPQPLR